MRLPLIAALITAFLSPGAFAQSANDNPGIQAGETYALLLGATILPRAAAEQVPARCVADVPAFAEIAARAAEEWRKRNAPLEAAAARLAENVAERIGSEIGAETFDLMRRRIDETLRTASARMIETLFNEVFGALTGTEREAACGILFRQMGEGRFDVAAVQPEGFRLISEGTALLGRWKHLAGTTLLADGTIVRNPPDVRCLLEFTVTTLTTECEAPKAGRYVSVSKYMLVGPGEYRAQVIKNERAPQMVGLRSGGEFRFKDGQLLLTSYPPSIRGNPPKAPIKTIGEWERAK